MKTILIIIGVIVIIFGVGYLITTTSEESTEGIQESAAEAMLGNNAIAPKETTVTNTSTSTDATATTDVAPGIYTVYDADAIAHSVAKHIVLFFHASWCPSCKALESDIVAHADSIPAGVEIYKVDYDTATALKRQYGITVQHSIVEITASGEALSGISHPLTLKALLATL